MGAGENDRKQNPSCQLVPGGFAGTGPNGSFFETPGWVDKVYRTQDTPHSVSLFYEHPTPKNLLLSQDKAPGMTSQTPAVAPPGWWIKLVTGYFLFFSPNLVWLAIALADYFLFPYDYEAAKSLTELNWVFKRFK